VGLIPSLKIWKGKGQPLQEAYTIHPTQRTIQGTGHELPHRAFLRVTRFLVSVTRPFCGLTTLHASPAPDSTRRPHPPVHRGNRGNTGSPVVSLSLSTEARASLVVLSLPFLCSPVCSKMQEEPLESCRRRSSSVAASQADLPEL
jgi:hypothetical protein